MPTQRKSKSVAESNGSAIFTTPDALGDTGRAQLVAQMLMSLQEQRFRLDMVKLVNSDEDDDLIPGEPPGENGKLRTYADKRQVLLDAERRLMEAHESIMDEVHSLLRQAAEKKGG